jgi:hypothetical protein
MLLAYTFFIIHISSRYLLVRIGATEIEVISGGSKKPVMTLCETFKMSSIPKRRRESKNGKGRDGRKGRRSRTPRSSSRGWEDKMIR